HQFFGVPRIADRGAPFLLRIGVAVVSSEPDSALVEHGHVRSGSMGVELTAPFSGSTVLHGRQPSQVTSSRGMVVAGDGGIVAPRADCLPLLGEPRDENPPFGVCLGPSKSTDKPVMSEKATVGRAERHDPLQGATSLSGPLFPVLGRTRWFQYVRRPS